MKQLCIALLLGLVACGSSPEPIHKPKPVGTETKAKTRDGATIVVIGNGAPDLRSPSVHVAQQDAQTAAINDLKQRLSLFISALEMPDGETISDKAKRDSAIQPRLDAFLSTYHIVDKRYFSDGSMDIVAEISMSALVSAVLDTAEKKEKTAELSLIIDARKVKGLPLKLAPIFQDSKGVTLFADLKPPQVSIATSIDAARALAKKALLITLSESALANGAVVIPDAELEKVSKAGAASIILVPPL